MADTIISKRIAVLPPAEERAGGFPEARPKEANRNLMFVVLVLAGVFVACSLFYVWSHHQILSLAYDTSEAAREEQALLKENKKLRLELAALKSPGRIERVASQELGLVTPQKEQLIIVR